MHYLYIVLQINRRCSVEDLDDTIIIKQLKSRKRCTKFIHYSKWKSLSSVISLTSSDSSVVGETDPSSGRNI